MRPFTSILPCLSILLAGACSLFPQSNIPERVSLARHACQEPGFTPVLPPDVQPGHDLTVLAGGSVTTGDFVMSIWLYCDPTLSSDDPDGPHYSEIRYLGLRSEWRYLGRGIDHPSKTVLTVNGEPISGSGSGPGVTNGEINTHTGAIRTDGQTLALAATSGQPVEIMMTISAPDPLAAATLRVTLLTTPQGVVLADAQISQSRPK